MKTRLEHIDKYIRTIYQRDYMNYVKNGNRLVHQKFATLVQDTRDDMRTQLKISKAFADKEAADKKTSLFSRLMG